MPPRYIVNHFALIDRAYISSTKRHERTGGDARLNAFAQSLPQYDLDAAATATTTTYNGLTVQVIPGSAGTCMRAHFDGAYFSTCGPNFGGPTPVSEDGLVELLSVSGPQTPGAGDTLPSASGQVVALVPDGNPTVTLSYADGKSAAVPTVGNVVAVSSSTEDPITKLRFVRSKGTEGLDAAPSLTGPDNPHVP